MKENVNEVVKEGLCTSCGVCKGACNHNAITFNYDKENNTPIVNMSLCVNCGLCYKVCPGKGIQLNEISKTLFERETNIKNNLYIGHYLDTYIGYSNNMERRFHAATGGMTSEFLIYLLEKKYIDGAVVIRYNKNNPFMAEPFIATSKKDIDESKSSKYIIVSMDKIAEELNKTDKKKLVIVGLPCHIQGFRQLAKQRKKIKDKILGYFSLYCSVNKTKHSTNYYLYRYKIDPKSVKSFSFRDDGCMGYMKYTNFNNETLKKIPYMSYWFGSHSFFVNNRCTLCIDQLGELADISFGDIHIEPYKNDTIGTNSIIARSFYWNKILQDCQKDGYIFLEKINFEKIIESQIYTKIYKKGPGLKTNFLLRKLLHKKNPTYDYTFKGNVGFNDIIKELSKYVMRIIGHYPKLWFIVKFLDRNKD